MGYVNKLTVMGRLGRDPALFKGQIGTTVCRMSVATNSSYTKDGVKVTETEWHNVVTFGKRAEVAAQYLKKGREVYIEGPIRTRHWTDSKTNAPRERKELIATDIQFIGASPNAGKRTEGTPAPGAGDDEEPDMSVLDQVPGGDAGAG